MYITHPTHGDGTRPSRTQPPTATRKTTQNAGQCVHQPREGRGRNRQTPPKKNTGGEGGGRENGPQPPSRPPTQQGAAQPPTRKAPKTGPPKEHRGPPSQSRQQQTRSSGTQNAHTHTTLGQKKRASNPARKRGDGGTGTTRPRTGTASVQHLKAKAGHAKKKHTPTTQPRRAGHNRDHGPARTPTQHTPARKGGEQAGRANKHAPPHSTLNQEVQETTRDGRTSTHTPQHPSRSGGAQPKPRLQHVRSHRTPEPETAGGKRSAHATMRVPYPQPRQVGCRPEPKPNHKRHKPQPAKEGRHHQPHPNTPAQDPSQDWQGYRNPR